MKPLKLIVKKELTNACKSLNETSIAKNIRYVGVSHSTILKTFVDTVEDIPKKDHDKIPPNVIDFYNDLISDEVEKKPTKKSNTLTSPMEVGLAVVTVVNTLQEQLEKAMDNNTFKRATIRTLRTEIVALKQQIRKLEKKNKGKSIDLNAIMSKMGLV
jgi:polyhydroxyalkanoate synthesis regulator phasin